jgi:hypothetical protein
MILAELRMNNALKYFGFAQFFVGRGFYYLFFASFADETTEFESKFSVVSAIKLTSILWLILLLAGFLNIGLGILGYCIPLSGSSRKVVLLSNKSVLPEATTNDEAGTKTKNKKSSRPNSSRSRAGTPRSKPFVETKSNDVMKIDIPIREDSEESISRREVYEEDADDELDEVVTFEAGSPDLSSGTTSI